MQTRGLLSLVFTGCTSTHHGTLREAYDLRGRLQGADLVGPRHFMGWATEIQLLGSKFCKYLFPFVALEFRKLPVLIQFPFGF